MSKTVIAYVIAVEDYGDYDKDKTTLESNNIEFKDVVLDTGSTLSDNKRILDYAKKILMVCTPKTTARINENPSIKQDIKRNEEKVVFFTEDSNSPLPVGICGQTISNIDSLKHVLKQ